MEWTTIEPNDEGDWINQRSESFATHLAAAPGAEPSLFTLVTNGLKSNRDAWNYNSSSSALDANVPKMIDHYNTQVDAFAATHADLAGTVATKAETAKRFVDRDPRKFSWDHSDFTRLVQGY